MTRPEAMRLCREMYGTWTAPEIRGYLAGRGVLVSDSTIREWGDPDVAERYRARRARYNRERRAHDRFYGRIRLLRDCGVSYASIALLMAADVGLDLTEEQVRYSLATGHLPRSVMKAVVS